MRIAILTTGGTIDKTYDETAGMLRNRGSGLQEILDSLRINDATIDSIQVMSKDSMEMTEEDRRIILEYTRAALSTHDAVLVSHGTDTLAVTGEMLERELARLAKPVVLTGAMRPYVFRDTDAYQNLTEALIACRLLPAGVYVVMHNQVLKFPGVVKDKSRRTFVRESAKD
jgi:L-asparaginase